MSLTRELREAGSPIRAYLDGVSPVLAATRGSSSTARQMAGDLGLVDLAGKPLLVPAGEAVDGRLSGTAFDIRARIELGGFDPADSTSAAGVARLSDMASLVENGEHRAQVLATRTRRSDVRNLASRLGAIAVGLRIDRQIHTAARVSALVAASGDDHLLLGGRSAIPQRGLSHGQTVAAPFSTTR